MLKNTKEKDLYSICLYILSILFYLFFAFYDGIVLLPDSNSYIEMRLSREPLYPTFLAFLRLIFGTGNDLYLMVAVVLQSILAACAVASLSNFLRKRLTLPLVGGMLLFAVPLGVSLLCRFVARQASMYSNLILTEGITCSLFLLFSRYLLEYCIHKTKKSLFFSVALAFVMIATRKQMYFAFMLLVIGVVYVEVRQRKYLKGIKVALGCIITVLLLNAVFDYGYNYVLRGTAITHSSSNRFLTTMIFYTAEREDFENIKDESLKDVVFDIYDSCDTAGYLKHSAGEGWAQRVEHFGNSYDYIQLDIMWPIMYEYVAGQYDLSAEELEKEIDFLRSEIIKAVLPRVKFEIVATFMDNFLSGLVTTVAQNRPILIIYTWIIYCLYFVLLIINLKKNGMDFVSLFAIYTMISIVINVGIVSVVIFCQTRYTIYNMPLFYMSGLLLLFNIGIPSKINVKKEVLE